MIESQQVPVLTNEEKAWMRRAKESADRQDYDYSVALYAQLVSDHPTLIEARRGLRESQIEVKKHTSDQGINLQDQARLLWKYLQGLYRIYKKFPHVALKIAEEILSADPESKMGNNLLAQSARALQYLETEALAYETLTKAYPDDVIYPKVLAGMYLKIGDLENAQKAYERALVIKADDLEAYEGLRNVSAIRATKEGTPWTKEDPRKRYGSPRTSQESLQQLPDYFRSKNK